MKKYTLYVSICEENESWASSTHETTWAGGTVKAKSLKEAMQTFYDSRDCQDFVEKNIDFNNIHFYYENIFGNKTYYHGYIEL
jgi:hypothetical protein